MAIAGFLKQSTAVTVKVGPFVDETDGKTAETGLTIAQADVRLSKNGGNMAQKNEASSCTHDEIGVYDCPLSTTDTDASGVLSLFVHEAGALPVRLDFLVLPAQVYDSLVAGSDKLEVDPTLIEGSDATTQLQSAAAAALSAYDPPTQAELDAAVAPLATASALSTLSSAVATVDGVADAIKLVTDKLDDTLEDDGGTYRFTANALEEGPNAIGAGALQRTIGLTVGGNPLEGASVWLATDAAGTNVIIGPLTTDSGGEVTILVDAGTFYVWVQKDGYAAIVGQAVVVS